MRPRATIARAVAVAALGACALVSSAPASIRAAGVEAPLAGPPPPLDMRDFSDRGKYRNGRAGISFELRLRTKLVGDVFWRDRDVFVLPDNAYSRWLVADEMDYYFNRSKTWRLDPRIDACCLRSGHTDANGDAFVDGLPPGNYVLFAGVYTNSGDSKDVFTSVVGVDRSGHPAAASIPDLVFPDKTIEILYVLTPFTIGDDTRSLVVPMNVVADRIVKS